MRQFIEGIEWIHGKDIIHNDLQPKNLIVTFPNNLVLSEFGSAMLLPQVKLIRSNMFLFCY